MKNWMWLGIALLAVACGRPKSTYLMPPPQQIEEVQQDSKGLDVEYNPMVDILFVLDNSKSMEDELSLLRKNMHDFVKSFGDNSIIDYHIGVTMVHDSTRYNNEVVLKINPDTGAVQYREKGELLPIGDKRFIDRENLGNLESLFDIQTPYVPCNVWRNTSGKQFDSCKQPKPEGNLTLAKAAVGPEVEESFSPVIAALTDTKPSNTGFHRVGSHLVVIFVTDAEDSSPGVEAQSLFDQLYQIQRKDISMLSVYGVLCTNGDADCLTRTHSGGTIESDSRKIKEFIQLVSRNKQLAVQAGVLEPNPNRVSPILNLRSQSWGQELSALGLEIRKNTIERKIQLAARPEYDVKTGQPLIVVKYGSQKIPYDSKIGWTFDATTNMITVHEGVVIERETGSRILVRYTKVTDPRLSKPVN